eukprot:Hpha_TRINITY_DN15469_c4_g5::TRINITY_DN15469_c4_g5_i1::g.174577::m.174577
MRLWRWVEMRLKKMSQDQRELERRTLLFPGFFAFFVSGLITAALWFPPVGLVSYTLVGATILMGTSSTLLVTTKVSATNIAVFSLLPCVYVVMLFDWYSASVLNARQWTVSVIILDIFLTLRVREIWNLLVISTMLLWLVIERSESAFRFGLYDEGMKDAVEPGTIIGVCDCSNPPCSVTWYTPMTACIIFIIVFLLDYHFTRGFCRSMDEQLRVLETVISVSALVATRLAEYDVDAAESAVCSDRGQELPPGLLEPFQKLLANLRNYKRYLPQSCLPEGGQEEEISMESSLRSRVGIKGAMSAAGHDSPQWKSAIMVADNLSDASSVNSGIRRVESEIGGMPGKFARMGTMQSLEDSARMSDGGAPDHPSPGHATLGRSSRVEIESFGPGRLGSLKSDKKMVTLLCINHVGFLAAARTSGTSEIGAWMSEELTLFLAAVAEGRGIVDLVGGDHRWAVFNGSRSCVQHASMACICAVRFADLVGSNPFLADHPLARSVTMALTSGPVVCGHFGNQTLMRFMVMGSVWNHASILDRLAAHWRTQTVVDEMTFADAGHLFLASLRAAVVFPKRSKIPRRLWCLQGKKDVVEGQEWMYAMEHHTDPWANYNRAASAWIFGDTDDPRAADIEVDDNCLPTVRKEILALQARISSGEGGAFILKEVGILPFRPDQDDDLECVLQNISEPVRKHSYVGSRVSSLSPRLSLPM